MSRIIFTILISILSIKTGFSQVIGIGDSTLKVKTEYFNSDTLNVKLIVPYEKIEGIDWQKNMPWIVAVFIGVLTVLTNILISSQSRKSNKESLSQQLKSSGEVTEKQLRNAKEIALAQIDNSSRIVQLDFNKTVLSGNRQAWINTLRDSISDYISKCNSYRIKLDQLKSLGKKAVQTSDNYDLTEILRLELKIVLMLNSNEEDSKSLIELLGQYTIALFDDSVITQTPEFFQEEIIKSTKYILKKEWERVKKGE